jgi:alpha-galactosidase
MHVHAPVRLLATLTLLAAAFPLARGAEEPMPVFILAGQSNMEGGGKVEELPAEWKTPQQEAQLVRFWETEFKPLDPAKLGKNFGPEVTFGAEMAKALGRPVGMIKLSVGGTSIEQHWNPTVFDKQKHTGELYKRLVDYVHGIQAKNRNIRIAGMIWMQGEADSRYHAKTTAQYQEKLEALIAGCRAEFGATNMPFVCGRVNPPDWPYQKQVREAQETAKSASYAWINCDDLEKHPDKLHYNTAGQIELGKRFAAGMLKLMPPAPEKKK